MRLTKGEWRVAHCVFCAGELERGEAIRLGSKNVCAICARAFAAEQVGRFGDAYRRQSACRFLEEIRYRRDWTGLFWNYWLDGLEKAERLRVLKEAYRRERETDGAWCAEWEKSFCLEGDDWVDFVKREMEDEQ